MKQTNKNIGVFLLMAILVVAPFTYASSKWANESSPSVDTIFNEINSSEVSQTDLKQNISQPYEEINSVIDEDENTTYRKVLIANLNSKFVLPQYWAASIGDYNNLKVYFAKTIELERCGLENQEKCINGQPTIVLTISRINDDGQTSTGKDLYIHPGEELEAFGLRFYLLSYDSANHAVYLLVTKRPVNYVDNAEYPKPIYPIEPTIVEYPPTKPIKTNFSEDIVYGQGQNMPTISDKRSSN